MPSCQRCLSRSALLRSQLTGDISANTGRIVAGVDANDSSSPRTTDNPVGCIDGAVAGAPCQMAHRRYHYTASMLLPAAMRSMQHSVPQMAQLHRRRNRVPKPTKTQSWQPSSGGHTAHLSCRRHDPTDASRTGPRLVAQLGLGHPGAALMCHVGTRSTRQQLATIATEQTE